MPSKQTWRNVAIIGFLFSVAVVNGFLGNAVLFGFTAETLDGSLKGQDTRLFPDASPAQQPWIVVWIVIVGLPFIFCSLFHLMRCQLLIGAEQVILRQLVYSFSMMALMMGALITCGFALTELYSQTPSEWRLTAGLNTLGVYVFVWTISLAGMLFGLEMLRQRRVPRWLAWLSLLSNAAAILCHTLAQNPDYPAFRLIIGLPLVSFDVIVWGFFAWLLSLNDSEKTALARTPPQ
jgi:hypothetical protein